jgi:MFS family permease
VTAIFRLFRDSYSGLSRETWLLGIVTLVNRSGMMVLPFLSLYLTSAMHFTVSQAGIVTAFFGIGSMIGSYLGGWLSDRTGYFRVQIFSLVAGGIACIAMAFINGFIAICVGMLVTAAILDMLRPAMSGAVTSFAKPENVTRSFSLIRMAINLGAGIGPAIAGMLAAYSFSLIFIGDGITSVAAGIVMYFYFRHKILKRSGTKKKEHGVTSPLTNYTFMVYIFFCLLYAIIFFQLFTTLPLFYEQVHELSKQQTGYLLALNGLIVFVFEMAIVFKLENRFDVKKVIAAGVILSGIGLVILNFTMSPWVLIVSMVLLSFSEIFAMPFMMTVVVNKTDARNRGMYIGTYTTAWSAAFIISPITGTFIVTHYGYNVLWWTMGVLSVVTFAGLWMVTGRLKVAS